MFALMTAAAIFAVLLPLGLRSRKPVDGSEANVYRDQLAELERDFGAGSIGTAELEAMSALGQRRTIASICISDPAARARPDEEAQFHIAE